MKVDQDLRLRERKLDNAVIGCLNKAHDEMILAWSFDT
jgi:hypothetical protein